MIDRLQLAKRPDQIIICTSTLDQDDPLEEIAKQEAIECFRGHPDDVLLRLKCAADHFGIDVVVSCTADNPFVDPNYIDHLVDFHVARQNDYSIVDGLPWGTFSYTLSYPAMERACHVKVETDTEVWMGYFAQTGMFKGGTLRVSDPRYRRPNLRLTVDTSEDLALVVKIFDALYVEGQVFGLREIVKLCDSHPDLAELNSHVEQKPAKPIRIRSYDKKGEAEICTDDASGGSR